MAVDEHMKALVSSDQLKKEEEVHMLADMQFDEMTKWSQNIQQVHMHNMFATCSSALPFASAVSVCNLMFPTAPCV